ncbi:MAG: DUF5615 family PIN-like protein [Bacteroidia bacterium]
MKFIIDAQLPLGLQKWLLDKGYDVIHTNDLPPVDQDRVVISKDSDFFKHYLLNNTPRRLLMISTGNIINKELIRLFELNFDQIKELFDEGGLVVEIDNHSIFLHQKE